MSDLENLVRESLRARVESAPTMDSPADRAIAGAAAHRRRSVLITAGSLVVMVALTIGGFALLNQPTPPVAVPAAASTSSHTSMGTAAPRPDLLIDPATDSGGWHALQTAAGQTIPFNRVGGSVDTAYQVPGGWLVSDRLGDVWLLRADGEAYALLHGVDGYAVAPDGAGIAWRVGDRLYVGDLSGTSLLEDRSTPAPPRGVPIAYTGTAVILGYSTTGGGIDQHDVWVPANGDYSPSWDATQLVTAVYQPAPNGLLLGVVRPLATGKDTCLAMLDPMADLKPTKLACGLNLTIDPTGLVSPDGRWLATTALSPGGQPETVLIDIDAVFDHPAVLMTWDAVAPLAWVDGATVVLTRADRSLVVARLGQANLQPLNGSGLPVRRLVGPQ
jgi:hypothetical protein